VGALTDEVVSLRGFCSAVTTGIRRYTLREWDASTVASEPLDGRVEHLWTHDDRLAQLADLESLCSRMAALFAAHRDSRAAELLSAKAAHAARLLHEGFEQPDLNALGGQFPDAAWWLNPKALDYNASREPWQDEVAQLHQHARAVALDLRSLATLYRR
jgi:hypothetical protein